MTDLLSFLSVPTMLPFTGAIVVVLVILVVEVALLLISGMHLDSLFPDLHVDADINAHHGFDLGDFTEHWLHVGKVPLVVLLTLAFGGFGAGGLLVQSLAKTFLGAHVSLWIAVPLALVIAVVVVRNLALVLGRLMPKDETTAVSAGQFLGQVAVINQGVASPGRAAEARLVDGHGQTHFLMVIPEDDISEFAEGTRVLLIDRRENLFTAAAVPQTPLAP